MDQKLYPFDEKRFQNLAKAWCTRKPAWIWCRISMVLFFLLGLAITSYFVLFMSGGTVTGTWLAFGAGSIFTAAIWSTGYAVYRLVSKHMGAPYEAMRDLFLETGEKGIRFGYHDRYERKTPNSVIVWSIAWQNIEAVEYDAENDLLRVWGRVERIEYEDLISGRIRSSYTKGQFGDLYPFSFFCCFDHKDEFRQTLQAHNIQIQLSGEVHFHDDNRQTL